MKIGSFNPHPTDRLGAFLPVYVKMYDSASVSILTQPSGWMQLDGLAILDLVSILTQPYWMCAASGGTEWSRMLLLVSILTQPIGWVQPNLSPNYEGRLFQSSSNLPAGCRAGPMRISILTQPRVWVPVRSDPNFNPHPT